MFIGLSVGNLLSAEDLDLMAPDRIVFAMANPDPEVSPRIGAFTLPHLCHRTLGFSQPDQQRVGISRHLPRRARCAGERDKRIDETRSRTRISGDDSAGRAERGLHHSQHLRQGRGAAGVTSRRSCCAHQRSRPSAVETCPRNARPDKPNLPACSPFALTSRILQRRCGPMLQCARSSGASDVDALFLQQVHQVPKQHAQTNRVPAFEDRGQHGIRRRHHDGGACRQLLSHRARTG